MYSWMYIHFECRFVWFKSLSYKIISKSHPNDQKWASNIKNHQTSSKYPTYITHKNHQKPLQTNSGERSVPGAAMTTGLDPSGTAATMELGGETGRNLRGGRWSCSWDFCRLFDLISWDCDGNFMGLWWELDGILIGVLWCFMGIW